MPTGFQLPVIFIHCYNVPRRVEKYCHIHVSVCLFVGLSVCLLACLNKCSAVAEMGNCLATIDMGQKLGRGGLPPFGGSWVPI